MSVHMCAAVHKLPKQIFWSFTVTHVSPLPLQHTLCLYMCVYVRDRSVSVGTTVRLATEQHSTAASVSRQTEDIYSLVNTHTNVQSDTEAGLRQHFSQSSSIGF